ncbi:4Fe-4S dicluster domain-containing protein [Caballeronia arvi]|uniref:4Fe-4S dicluster domain-containing protein n=1 Tax=Caballeronia arvi TaxID=1777135 RepID=UPI00117D1AFC
MRCCSSSKAWTWPTHSSSTRRTEAHCKTCDVRPDAFVVWVTPAGSGGSSYRMCE